MYVSEVIYCGRFLNRKWLIRIDYDFYKLDYSKLLEIKWLRIKNKVFFYSFCD